MGLMAQLLRVSIKGALPGGETWSTNPVWTISDFGVETTPAQIQAVADACAAVAVPANLLLALSTSTNIHTIRVEARSADGALENLAESIRAVPAGGSGGSPHTFQTAWVASLRTAQVGATGRGRLYWPATGQALAAATLRPSVANVDTWVAAIKTYLSGLQTAIRTVFPGSGLIVWSRKTHGMYLVDTIQAGDVLDQQRRRRDSLVEAYSAVSFP